MRVIMTTIENYSYPAPADPAQEQLISVIVAVYNIAPYLERCVRSILAQTYRNLEILLVDDGSTDESGRMCDRLAREDERIRVLHKPNGGLSDARNAGTQASRGEYIAFVDGDDWLEPDMYGNMHACMQEFQASLAVCRYKQVYRDRTLDGSTGRVVLLEGEEPLEEFLAENDAIPIRNAAWNKLARRELIGELRFPKGKLYEDIVYTTKLLHRCRRCVYLDRAGYNYVLEREGSIMGKGMGERIFTDQIPAYEEKEAFLRSIGRDDLADQHRYFYYKRLLAYYNRCMRSADPVQRSCCQRIRELILPGAGEMERIYSCRGASGNEKKKMAVFLKSPAAYRVMTELNEKILLPLKTRSKAPVNKGFRRKPW